MGVPGLPGREGKPGVRGRKGEACGDSVTTDKGICPLGVPGPPGSPGSPGTRVSGCTPPYSGSGVRREERACVLLSSCCLLCSACSQPQGSAVSCTFLSCLGI